MAFVDRCQLVGGSLALCLATIAGNVEAAAPSADQALKLQPVQKDVEYDRPNAAETARATIKAEEFGKSSGWVVRDGSGQMLRRFLDTNGDNVVDQWSYFNAGLEVYRDIDLNFNGKVDQCRWLNTGGSRWGLDNDEDGKVDVWKTISAEEVSSEVVAALANRDASRFARLLLTATELKSLGLSEAKLKAVSTKLEGATTAFQSLVTKQKSVTAKTTWVHFGGTRPGTVPAGTDGSTRDLVVYENVVAMTETDGKNGQLQIGTLIQVGDTWRLIGAPDLGEGSGEQVASGLFFQSTPANLPDQEEGPQGNDARSQKLLAELEKIDQAVNKATSAVQQAPLNAQRADVLEELSRNAASPEDKAQWMRQLADTVSAAAQSGGYPAGVERLKQLCERLSKDGADSDLMAYVKFRMLTADYTVGIQSTTANFPQLQAKWLEDLKKFTEDYPTSADTAEALLQLAIAQEFAGQEEDAKKWYAEIVAKFPKSAPARKAAGAKTRLDSVGKSIDLKGPSPTGGTVALTQYAGKVVVIQYWATWCEPAKADLAQLKELQAKYGKSGLTIIGVSLDGRKEDLMEYLKTNRLPWAQIYEPGGLDSRLANDLGILTLPTMILIDKQGRVANRNVHVTELDREVNSLLR